MGTNSQGAQRLVAGRYRLDDVLGRGGMGVVWRGHDELIGRSVAVKELRLPQGVSDQERADFGERALREARTAGRLNHPAVVAIYDLVSNTEEDGSVYIVMELVDVPSLAEILERYRTLAEDRVTGIAVQLLGVLQAAHSIGLVHRDIKPSNIMVLPSGAVKLVDFGIAHAMDDTRLTRNGVAGSTGYMAPELFAGADPSPAADLWSLGATLFHATEGHDPFARQTPAATLHAILHDNLPPLSCHPPLSTVITGLLTRDTAGRMTGRQADTLLQSTAPPTVAPAGPVTAVRRDEPTTASPVTRSSDTPQAATPPRSGEGAWAGHPTAVNPAITPPYAVVLPQSVRVFHRGGCFLLLAAFTDLVWGNVLAFTGDSFSLLPFLPLFLIGVLSHSIRPTFQGWVNLTSERITLSRRKNPKPATPAFIAWEHIDEVVISRGTQAGQENSNQVRTTLTLRISASMPNDVKGASFLANRTPGEPYSWEIKNLAAPTEAVAAAFRAITPASVRVSLDAGIDTQEDNYPGAFRLAFLAASLIATVWVTVSVLLMAVGS